MNLFMTEFRMKFISIIGHRCVGLKTLHMATLALSEAVLNDVGGSL